MPILVILVIAVVVAVNRARKRIVEVEGPGEHRVVAPPRAERWRDAVGVEKAAFVVMAISGALWLVLILPIAFAAAVAALGLTVWKRPYLEATLAPVVLIGGTAVLLYDLLLPVLRDDGDVGASVVTAALFGGLWILIGVLLRAAGRHSRAPDRASADRHGA
jgi:hypothetical protein